MRCHIDLGMSETAYIFLGVAQLVERVIWDHEAVGSCPTTQTSLRLITAQFASTVGLRYLWALVIELV